MHVAFVPASIFLFALSLLLVVDTWRHVVAGGHTQWVRVTAALALAIFAWAAIPFSLFEAIADVVR